MPQQRSNVPAASSQGKAKTRKRIAKLEARLPPYLQVMVNPFQADTEGAGRPDHNSAPTVVWAEKGSFTATTNADGNFWLQFTPALKGLYYTAAFTGGTTAITGVTTSDAPNYTALSSSFSALRPYALAVEVEYIGAADVSKGVIGTCNCNQFINAAASDFTMLYDEPCYAESGVDQKLAVISRYVDNSVFNPLTSELYGAGVTPGSVIHIIGTGMPASSACVRVRWRLIAEFIAGPTSLMARKQAFSIANPSQISAAANLVGMRSQVAFGDDPVEKLKTHALNLIEVAGAVNGLWNAAKPIAGLVADFAMMVA